LSWLINDLETNNKPYYGQLASPHHPDNYIVATGWAIDDGPVQHKYFNSRAEADADNWLEVALATATVYVAHNATFEIHWLLSRHKQVFLDFIKRGGRIYCTQYARYLLSHQTETYPSLEDCSLLYGGTKKIDEVKLLWEQGVLTADIPKELLLRYLAGPDGDIENTRKVLFGTYAELVAKGMTDMFWERMDSLLFNAVSTFNGLFIDLEVAQRNHKAQLERVAEIKAQVDALLPADMPKELEFNYGSDYHMSAFLFGGPIKYTTKVPYDPPKFEKGDFYRVDNKLIPVDNPNNEDLTWADRYQRGKNQGQLKIYREDTDKPKLKNADAIYTFAGLIPLNTLPAHVQEKYVSKRAEFRGKRFLCDRVVDVDFFGEETVLVEGTPVYSTGKDSLELLANFTEVAKPLKELASLEKDNGTYYITYTYNADGTVKNTKGMLQYVTPANIVHHSLNGTSTITGRLSSSNPNLQNLPRDGTSKVKEMFASRFGSAGRIVEVDYTALEVVALAAISGDDNLMAALLNNIDMHCQRLAGVLGEPYEEVYEKCHNKEHPEHKHYKQLRTDIKPRAFAAQYGASAAGISFATGCTIEDAQTFLDAEAKLYPRSISYRQVVRSKVEQNGAKHPPKREIRDDGGFGAYREGHFDLFDGATRYAFRTFEKRVEGQLVQDYKDTQLANYWCQGEASFIVQVACGRVIRWLIANDFFGGCVLPINTVHDAIYLDCVNEEWARYAGKMVQQIMESTPKYMVERMPQYQQYRYHTTPFPAAAEFGPNMMKKESC